MPTPRIPKGFQPVVSGYSFGGPGGAMRTEVAGGAARYGMEWDRGPQQFNVTLMLTKLQLQIWVAFYHQIIKKGTISFEMPLDSGFGLSMHTVNIVPDSYSVADVNFAMATVGFVVEAESQAYLFDEDESAGLIELYEQYGEEANPLLARIAQFANQDTLVLNF